MSATPVEGEVRIRSTAVGLNYIDVYHRDGTYPVELPSGLGTESVGVIEAVGPGVDDWKVGDRVGTSGPELGAYATQRLLKAERLMAIPDAVSDRDAAALLLKGGTCEYLVERCARAQAGDTVLVHAAAGGVGHLLVGWLKAIGARVIGTVGSEEKAEQARAGRRRSRHPPQERGCRRQGEGVHRRRGRGDGVRRRRRRDVGAIARLLRAARSGDQLRQCRRTGDGGQPADR